MTIFSAATFAVGIATMTIPTMVNADSHAAMVEHGTLHVAKDPTCGCCGAWVALAREEGFDVETTDTDDIAGAKLDAGVPEALWSCHTATIDGYVIEGHVPFAAIAKLLEARPDVAGIAVPGMPFGSPGMGDDPDARYDVIAFGGTAGEGTVFYRAGL
ncbi:MAG: DUF411 domain-containing protein [Erythrobacter sp.]